MRRLTLTMILLLLAVSLRSADAQTTAGASDRPVSPVSTIDNVDVPFHVVQSVQMDNQGYAIVQVMVIGTAPELSYRIRIDQDDRLDDYNGKYILYDKNWNARSIEDIKPPPVRREVAPPPSVEVPQEKEEEKPPDEERREEKPDEEKPPVVQPPRRGGETDEENVEPQPPQTPDAAEGD